MRAAALTVRADAVEAVLDRLLPRLDGGLYEERRNGAVELTVPIGKDGRPARSDLEGAAGGALLALTERELPDDPLARRRALFRPPVVAGRFVVRPPWAAAPSDPGLEDLVIDRGRAFGTGVHPTTRRCLEVLLRLTPGGTFADLGCGTGVLAIAAARLGWAPVEAVDLDPAAVEVTAANARRNGVAVATVERDLVAEPPPVAATMAANAPPPIQAAIAAALSAPPRQLVVSGVGPADADAVAGAYAAHGLERRLRIDDGEWTTQVLAPAGVELRSPAPPAGDEGQVANRRPRIRVPAAALRGRPGGTAGASATDATPEPAGQIRTALPGGRVALSSALEAGDGTRAAVLLAPGLFRLDVQPAEDTFRVAVRNLGGSPLRMRSERAPDVVVDHDEVAAVRPLHTATAMTIVVATRPRPTEARVTISALAMPERASARIAAQALIGPAA